ncbi:MAG: hypothetical protein SOV16_08265 [Anaerobiospirillum succiniciproducens]|uniref:hypothetical protein n=1 Tax=Anaerobiospirillum succiniciproducens TaxID=13335 RepID=UPI002A757F8B|nr:hypothetical protein [Anaerobiospirillum succiniciproducens]MDY2799134.1 hypothetical protein [Anaerobiospirillum succiniciproducens]
MKFSIASNRADGNFKLDGGNDAVVDIKNNNIAFLFSKADASLVISHMDKMIADVDGLRANLGAIQNHFPAISSPHKTSSKPDILAVLNSFERMATFRWFFCA